MGEIRWQFNQINLTLYRGTAEGLWVAFSSTSDSHRTAEETNMESWLADRAFVPRTLQSCSVTQRKPANQR